MVKLWEIDFTDFSGIQPQDNIGTQNLTSVIGTPFVLSTVGGLTNRPGIRFDINNVDQRYQIHTAAANNAKFIHNYSPTSKRSFVMWCYKPTNTRDTENSLIWGDHNSNTYRNGFTINTSNQFQFFVDSTSRHTTATQGASTWHMLAMTVDRTLPQTVLYYQGQAVASGSYVPGTVEGAGYNCIIGDSFQTREPGLDFGLVGTYDNVLSPQSVEDLYEAFLLDSSTGEDPIFTLSGTIYDPLDTAVSGAPVALYSVNDNEVYERVNATASGYYEIHIPFAGDFVLLTSSFPPNIGARAVSLTASGVAGSGTVTFHD